MPVPYVELHCHSNFSFLDGGSHPYELVARAADLEMPALAITDTGGVYGAVRFLQACRKLGVKPMIGTALEVDGEELVLIARNLCGYSNLCRLLTDAHHDQPKGEARATLAKVARHRGDLFYLSATDEERRLRDLQEALGRESVFSELHHHLRADDSWTLEGRADMARSPSSTRRRSVISVLICSQPIGSSCALRQTVQRLATTMRLPHPSGSAAVFILTLTLPLSSRSCAIRRCGSR